MRSSNLYLTIRQKLCQKNKKLRTCYAELFSRIVQLEKRGIVIGDVSAGAVMRSKQYDHELGVDTVMFYGASITDADIFSLIA